MLTLQRALAALSLREKAMLLMDLVGGLFFFFGRDRGADPEKWRNQAKDTLNALLQEFGQKYPLLKRALSRSGISSSPRKSARLTRPRRSSVIGAGHSQGIQLYLQKSMEFKSLEEMPPKKPNPIGLILQWADSALFVILLGWIVLTKGVGASLAFFGYWFLITGGLSALGVLHRARALAIGPDRLCRRAVLPRFILPGRGLVRGLRRGQNALAPSRRLRDAAQAQFARRFRRQPRKRILLVIGLSNLGPWPAAFSHSRPSGRS